MFSSKLIVWWPIISGHWHFGFRFLWELRHRLIAFALSLSSNSDCSLMMWISDGAPPLFSVFATCQWQTWPLNKPSVANGSEQRQLHAGQETEWRSHQSCWHTGNYWGASCHQMSGRPIKKTFLLFFFFAPDDPVFCADIRKLKPFSSLKYLKSTTIQSFSRILF